MELLTVKDIEEAFVYNLKDIVRKNQGVLGETDDLTLDFIINENAKMCDSDQLEISDFVALINKILLKGQTIYIKKELQGGMLYEAQNLQFHVDVLNVKDEKKDFNKYEKTTFSPKSFSENVAMNLLIMSNFDFFDSNLYSEDIQDYLLNLLTKTGVVNKQDLKRENLINAIEANVFSPNGALKPEKYKDINIELNRFMRKSGVKCDKLTKQQVLISVMGILESAALIDKNLSNKAFETIRMKSWFISQILEVELIRTFNKSLKDDVILSSSKNISFFLTQTNEFLYKFNYVNKQTYDEMKSSQGSTNLGLKLIDNFFEIITQCADNNIKEIQYFLKKNLTYLKNPILKERVKYLVIHLAKNEKYIPKISSEFSIDRMIIAERKKREIQKNNVNNIFESDVESFFQKNTVIEHSITLDDFPVFLFYKTNIDDMEVADFRPLIQLFNESVKNTQLGYKISIKGNNVSIETTESEEPHKEQFFNLLKRCAAIFVSYEGVIKKCEDEITAVIRESLLLEKIENNNEKEILVSVKRPKI